MPVLVEIHIILLNVNLLSFHSHCLPSSLLSLLFLSGKPFYLSVVAGLSVGGGIIHS